MNYESFKAGFESLVDVYLKDHNLDTHNKIYICWCRFDNSGEGVLYAEIAEYDLYLEYTVTQKGRAEYLRAYRMLGGLCRHADIDWAYGVQYVTDSKIQTYYKDSTDSNVTFTAGVEWAKDYPCNGEDE